MYCKVSGYLAYNARYRDMGEWIIHAPAHVTGFSMRKDSAVRGERKVNWCEASTELQF